MVRKAAKPSGTTDPKGRPAKVWLAISEPPEQRRKTRQLSKTKRAVLEIAEKQGAHLVVGTLWLDQQRIAGVGQPPVGKVGVWMA